MLPSTTTVSHNEDNIPAKVKGFELQPYIE